MEAGPGEGRSFTSQKSVADVSKVGRLRLKSRSLTSQKSAVSVSKAGRRRLKSRSSTPQKSAIDVSKVSHRHLKSRSSPSQKSAVSVSKVGRLHLKSRPSPSQKPVSRLASTAYLVDVFIPGGHFLLAVVLHSRRGLVDGGVVLVAKAGNESVGRSVGRSASQSVDRWKAICIVRVGNGWLAVWLFASWLLVCEEGRKPFVLYPHRAVATGPGSVVGVCCCCCFGCCFVLFWFGLAGSCFAPASACASFSSRMRSQLASDTGHRLIDSTPFASITFTRNPLRHVRPGP